ncbi:MAG: RNA polymerase sigma factor [Paludisphaera borealis]|uniref:RNA polymerase sigma factor n=1 Tax=Paludisphaera borealis TaxID=1387353 RepID=UPI00285190D3|nr:RNA polymerase sigma factor [Paludisphaera borealis]MDR3620415.1 RNA polymerase sigma factor [Paludisphaera borealis]
MATTRLAGDDTELLLRHAADGDAVALQKLLGRHRDRLRRMVALRLSSHQAAQIDASDVVREALVEAERKLADYVRDRPMAFYPWLHRLVAARLTLTRRRHMPTEADRGLLNEDDTIVKTAGSRQLLAALRNDDETTPGQAHVLKESHPRTRAALERLNPPDREILVMHYLEELNFSEIAAILGVDEATAKMQHLRALQRIRVLINIRDPEGG